MIKPLSDFLKHIAELSSRMDHYKKKRDSVDLSKVHVELIGAYKGKKFWLVDGTYIRDKIDEDFVEGGNPGRYSYVPEHEFWIEKVMVIKDQLCTMVHEYVERDKMELEHWSYDRAHNYALGVEKKIREDMPKKGSLMKDFLYFMDNMDNADEKK